MPWPPGFDGVELHCRQWLSAGAVHPPQLQHSHRPVRRLHRESRALSAGRGRGGGRGDRQGKGRNPPVAIRVFNDMPMYDAMEADYIYLAEQLNALGLVYLHIVDHSAMGAPAVPDSIKKAMRRAFKGALNSFRWLRSGARREDLAAGNGDLIAGRPPLPGQPRPAGTLAGERPAKISRTSALSTHRGQGIYGLSDDIGKAGTTNKNGAEQTQEVGVIKSNSLRPHSPPTRPPEYLTRTRRSTDTKYSRAPSN